MGAIGQVECWAWIRTMGQVLEISCWGEWIDYGEIVGLCRLREKRGDSVERRRRYDGSVGRWRHRTVCL